MPASPTLFRRFVAATARIGLDMRPVGRRFREATLRPLRAEVSAGFAQAEAADQALRAHLALLQGQLAALQEQTQVLQNQSHALQEQVTLSHQRGDEFQRHIAEAQAAAAADRHRMDQQQAALDNLASLFETLSRNTDRNFRDSQAQGAALASEVAALQHLAMAEKQDWRDRVFRIERLISAFAENNSGAATWARPGSPRVSIILPTFNRADFLVEAIESVQAQTCPDWELVIVDDGSTDETADVVWFYLSDLRIRLVRQAQAGAAVARNRGIAETTAPLIAYIDSDNLWCPGFLRAAVDALDAQPDVDLVYGALITDSHRLDHSCILWSGFDRDKLVAGNYIDTNTIVHRRSLVARWGGWDKALRRLLDWDLLLRYTAEKPAKPIPALAARYRQCDTRRITDIVPDGPDEVAVRAKWFPPAQPARRPRVLYVAWHYPQLSETYIETEILCMRDWGVHVELWRSATGPSPYPTVVPIHDGSLAEAIAASQPDIIHVHWLSFGLTHRDALAASGLPVTLRLHGFDTTPDGLAAWLAHDWARRVFGFPVQLARTGLVDSRLVAMPVAFDTRLFKPQPAKNRRMVVRTAAALPSKDLELFLEAARRLPGYRFVLVAVTCHLREDVVVALKTACEELQSPVELRLDLPREAVAALVGEAAIYLHTVQPVDAAEATPAGQPISIAEAMATGAYCLVRHVPDLVEMVGQAGTAYDSIDDLVTAITATEDWSDAEWQAAHNRAVTQAWGRHADTMVLRPLFREWMALSAEAAQG